MAIDRALLAPREVSVMHDAAPIQPVAPPATEPAPVGLRDEAVASPAPAPAMPVQRALSGDADIAPSSKGVEPGLPAPVPPIAKPGLSPPSKAASNVPSDARIAVAQKATAALPSAGRPEPVLDVLALKARLRDTGAIGIFTKLALSNQVDDLLGQFRAHYLNTGKGSVAALRQPYDMLVMKVLALIQDSDPPLAHTISGSREAIWAILADPVKFKAAN